MSSQAQKRPPTVAQMQRACDRWNERHPVGTSVAVTLDSGEVTVTKTRSEAQILSGHTAVIWLDGITGCYLLDRVRAEA